MTRRTITETESPIMEEKTRFHQLANGLVILGKEIPWSQSVSYMLQLPCGSVDDPSGRQGCSRLLTEMVARGAGQYDNRALLAAFENLGADASESVSKTCSTYCVSMLFDKFPEVLSLTADMVLRPHFPEEELEPSRQSLLQEIAALEDEPSRKMMIALNAMFYGDHWSHPSFGTPETLNAVTLDDIIGQHRRLISPQGAILGIAGRFDWEKVVRLVNDLFGGWSGQQRSFPESKEVTTLTKHIPFESSQTQIGLIWPAPSLDDPLSRPYRMALSILSGGMSSRLFTEVREKRGLCYSVYASYSALKGNRSSVYCYCGSGNDTAQEALDVIVEELQKISREGVNEEEFQRMKVRLKSDLVIGLEPCSARASAMVSDWFYLGRVREMAELEAEVDALTCQKVNDALRRCPFGPFRLAVLGPNPLRIDPTILG